ncbi:MAG TPA: ABC transporter permease, partial [Cryomorphaceae bacterium]|nr:ABC transporter permease [Cryomorphaceae bacterium]
FRTLKATTVGTDDLLFEKIISKENAIWVKPGLSYNCDDCLKSCEVIVTEKGMSLLSHDPTNSDLSHIFAMDGSGVVPIEVVAVVKSLPNFYEIACSIEFFNINDSNEGQEYIDHFKDGDNACKFLIDPGVSEFQVDSLGQAYFKRAVETELQQTVTSGGSEWRQAIVYFPATNAPSLESIEEFIVFARKNGVHLGLMAEYSCRADKLDRLPLVHNIAFNFTDLNEIRAFKEDMALDGIEIDTKQIEVKENFALVSSLTWTISVILLAFGVLSIILFVNNLLRTHLFKVRTNLGTFKAFGLSNSFLNTIYLKIISVFLLIAILIAFLLAGIVDLIEHLIYEESKFNIMSHWVLVAILLLVGVSLFISFRTSKKILGDTPGNLIYNR